MRTATLAGLAFLLLASSVASAQVAATIDSRGVTPSFPSVHITGGTGDSSTSAGAKAQLTFSLLDPRQLAVGEAFDFELAITNRSDEKRKGAPWL